MASLPKAKWGCLAVYVLNLTLPFSAASAPRYRTIIFSEDSDSVENNDVISERLSVSNIALANLKAMESQASANGGAPEAIAFFNTDNRATVNLIKI